MQNNNHYSTFIVAFLLIFMCIIPLVLLLKNFFLHKIRTTANKENTTMLKHLGVIMDGNRRWAKKHNVSVMEGYKVGSERFFDLLKLCLDEHIPTLTVYALTLDNVKKRPAAEIQTIITIGLELLKTNLKWFIENKIRINIIGNKDVFKDNPEYESVLDNIINACEKTKNGHLLTVNILIAYGSMDDLTHSTIEIAKKLQKKEITIDQIDEKMFKDNLLSGQVPPVDLLIRTGFHERLSDFLPIQSSYAEIKFLPVLWPEIIIPEIKKLIIDFANRQRNFGK